MAVAAVLYGQGLRLLWDEQVGRGIRGWEATCFAGNAGTRPRTTNLGIAVLLLFGTTLHSGALGALLTFSRTLWYPAYALACRAHCTLTPLEDQQLAGLIMWIPAAFAYLFAAVIQFAAWLHASEDRVHSRELARATQWTHRSMEDDWS
ncbi:MAG TPA: cytochrome c oxidase assembly protein [Gemmatimonadaceae bacterium]|nr:cytochrome c oxidase assembly protein [Gemmatimonadaceae bacterium]